MALTESYRRRHLGYFVIAVLTLVASAPVAARADFFDGVRRTFQTDIPHFFQDDIPCAFGGNPTSHTKTSCKSTNQPGKDAKVKPADRAAVPAGKANDVYDAPTRSNR